MLNDEGKTRMSAGLAIFVWFLIFSGCFAAAALYVILRLVPEPNQAGMWRWLGAWAVKGGAVPFLIWMLMNVGLSWSLQPFMPQVQAARNSGGPWFPEYLRVAGAGLFIISSYWVAITLGWVLVRAGLAAPEEPRKDFKGLCWTCVLGLFFPALLVLLIGGWASFGLAAGVVLIPMAGYAPSVLHRKRMPPMYARAVARMKFGKYNEAELEILRELEKCEEDFEGWMMLAELYANHFGDVAEAERTVLELCDQPGVTASQVSVALHRLADWQLRLAQQPLAARRALEVICNRFPGTHLAHMAQLRINQLPKTVEELREQRTAKPIPLPALSETDQPPRLAETPLERRQAARAANECVQRLKEDPDNVPAREKLARIFTEQLERADLGIEQVMLLLNMPGQPDERRAEWLGLVASWHLRYQKDFDTGRKFLERLIQEFPGSPQAYTARRRLNAATDERRQSAS